MAPRRKRPSSPTKQATNAEIQPPAKKKRGPKATPAPKAKPIPEDDDLERTIDWSDRDNTDLLITALKEDKTIKDGLYPPPGSHASTARGGGKTKTEHQARLAAIAFETHSTYGAAYRADKESGNKKKLQQWATKVKNRLDALASKTRSYTQQLGETGAGINSLDDVDLSRKNQFTNLVESILDVFPWYFDMKAFIAERPNANPVGLGNNSSKVDSDVLLPARGARNTGHKGAGEEGAGEESEEENEEQPAEEDLSERDASSMLELPSEDIASDGSYLPATRDVDHFSDESSELDETFFNPDGSVNRATKKPARSAASRAKVPPTTTTARPSSERQNGKQARSDAKTAPVGGGASRGASGKAATGALDKVKPGKVKLEDKFILAHAEEEKTRQRTIDLKIAESDVVKTKTETKLEKYRLKMQLRQEKWRHEERMAELSARQQAGVPFSMPFPPQGFGGPPGGYFGFGHHVNQPPLAIPSSLVPGPSFSSSVPTPHPESTSHDAAHSEPFSDAVPSPAIDPTLIKSVEDQLTEHK